MSAGTKPMRHRAALAPALRVQSPADRRQKPAPPGRAGNNQQIPTNFLTRQPKPFGLRFSKQATPFDKRSPNGCISLPGS